jgi:hypothetical protein
MRCDTGSGAAAGRAIARAPVISVPGRETRLVADEQIQMTRAARRPFGSGGILSSPPLAIPGLGSGRLQGGRGGDVPRPRFRSAAAQRCTAAGYSPPAASPCAPAPRPTAPGARAAGLASRADAWTVGYVKSMKHCWLEAASMPDAADHAAAKRSRPGSASCTGVSGGVRGISIPVRAGPGALRGALTVRIVVERAGPARSG